MKIQIAALVILLTVAGSVLSQQKTPMPTQRGADAIRTLKEKGTYESLKEAMKSVIKDAGGTDDSDNAVVGSTKLTSPDRSSNDQFGGSVAVSGDTAVVGADRENAGGIGNSGAAYVFVKIAGAWSLQATLTASDKAANDRFGSSVAIDGNTVVVGAYLEDTAPNTDNGAAYVFERSGTTWTQQAKLLADDAESDDRFGVSVAISVNTVVVGAYQEDTAPNTNNGAAYIFERGIGWAQHTKLLANDASSNDTFGFSVAISGDTVVVGAIAESTSPATQNGAAYVFYRLNVWVQAKKLIASDYQSSDFFGWSVAVSADTIVVGAVQESTAPYSGNGAAYVFSGSGWPQEAKLLASNIASGARFGNSVGISYAVVTVGAEMEESSASLPSGAAYVYTRLGSTWSEDSRIVPSDAAADDRFGSSVAVWGGEVIVGANLADVASTADSGAAYIYHLTGNSWVPDGRGQWPPFGYGDLFGSSVATSGGTVVVGAPGSDTLGLDSGSAYVFTRDQNGWVGRELIFLRMPGARAGSSVAISGNYLAVGAVGEDAVYIFRRNGLNWDNAGRIGGASGTQFGWSVGITDSRLVVGVKNAESDSRGRARVYRRDGDLWTTEAVLTAPDGQAFDEFGSSVAIDGDTVVVGAWLQDAGLNVDNGAAYVYQRNAKNGWDFQDKLLANGRASGDQFGGSVAISGDSVVVGARFESVGDNVKNGAAYVFVRNGTTWQQQVRLRAPDLASNDQFGGSVGISGDTVVVGAKFKLYKVSYADGAAYVFLRSAGAWGYLAKFNANQHDVNQQFGVSVAISSTRIAVGGLGLVPLQPTPVKDRNPLFGSTTGSVYFYVNALAPTAANVSIGGRIRTAAGTGVNNMTVSLTRPNGETITTLTSSFGYFRFEGLEVGETCIIWSDSERYSIDSRMITIEDGANDLDFVIRE